MGGNPKTGLNPLNPLQDGRQEHKVRGVFKALHFHTGVQASLTRYLADTSSEERFKHLCRAVCVAARLDPGGWEEYAGPDLDEVGKLARRRAEGEKKGA